VKRTADDWSQGIFNGSSVPGAWRPIVKARACGVTVPANPTDPLELDQLAAVVVWLEPDRIRDRWTPETVQRTVRVWLERGTVASP